MIIYQVMADASSNAYKSSTGVFTLESLQIDKKLLYILAITEKEDITDEQ